MDYSDKEKKYIKVKARVEKLRSFYTHLTVYMVVNGIIYSIRIVKNFLRGESFMDAIFDFSISGIWLVWGIVLIIHAFSVFGLPHILGNNWEEEKIKQFMEEDKHNNFK
ncbi:MAG: 2TM domain-containing protein [Flavobacteriaceae bacterium]|nr:2TM domain-containing protein [Flavobacteriaceae bacterium]